MLLRMKDGIDDKEERSNRQTDSILCVESENYHCGDAKTDKNSLRMLKILHDITADGQMIKAKIRGSGMLWHALDASR